MKMQPETKYFIGIILLSLLVSVSVQGAINPNDYYVMVGGINDIIITGGSDMMDISYPVYYVPIRGSASYTFTSNQVTTSINLSQPSQINTKIRNSIVNDATQQGYNIKKIIYQQYTVVNP